MNATMESIVIDPEIRDSIPPLRKAELQMLDESLQRDGCREPLVVWKGHGILLDGFHRKNVCERLGIPYEVVELGFASREDACDWVDLNQLARRNLSLDQMALLRGRRYNRLKKAQGGTGANQHREQSGQNVRSAKTGENLAKQHGVTERTIRRDGIFAKAVETMAVRNPDLPRQIAEGIAPAKAVVMQAAALQEFHPDQAQAILSGQRTQAEVQRELKRTEIVRHLQDTAAANPKAIDGLYDVIVIDPPWPMQKIERDERPNQSEFDYPTMTEEELAALKIPCAADCHVWLWTTQKFLPMALRLLEAWGLKYLCTFVWHKPGGFQPFELP